MQFDQTYKTLHLGLSASIAPRFVEHNISHKRTITNPGSPLNSRVLPKTVKLLKCKRQLLGPMPN